MCLLPCLVILIAILCMTPELYFTTHAPRSFCFRGPRTLPPKQNPRQHTIFDASSDEMAAHLGPVFCITENSTQSCSFLMRWRALQLWKQKRWHITSCCNLCSVSLKHLVMQVIPQTRTLVCSWTTSTNYVLLLDESKDPSSHTVDAIKCSERFTALHK